MSRTPATIDVMSEDAEMEDLLAPIRDRNRGKLLARLANVRAAIDAEVPPHEASSELRSDLHALIGALGTYGWPEGSHLMADIQSAVVKGQRAAHFGPAVDALMLAVQTP